jgi:hypothetical protein
MWIKILNSCRWSGGNKTPGVDLVITRFHKILLITRRHINVLHEDITYIQYYMAKWSYIIKNIKTYQQFSLWTIECSLSRSIFMKAANIECSLSRGNKCVPHE